MTMNPADGRAVGQNPQTVCQYTLLADRVQHISRRTTMTFMAYLMVIAAREIAAQSPSSVAVLMSQFTPADFRETVLEAKVRENIFDIIEYSPFSPPYTPAHAVLDILWSETLSQLHRDTAAAEVQVINGNDYELKNTTALDLDAKNELQQLAQVSRWLGIDRICVIISPLSPWLPDIQSMFPGAVVEVFIISERAELAALSVLVRRQIAPLGFTCFLVVLPPLTTKQLLLAFFSARLSTNQLVVMLSSKAAIYRFTIAEAELSGFLYLRPLYVTRRECSGARLIPELLLCQVELAIADPNGSDIALVQITNRTAKRIAWVRGDSVDLSNYQEAQLQPNSTNTIAAIQISINSGQGNITGVSEFNQIDVVSGAWLAVKDINAGIFILPFFKLEVSNLSLGANEFDANWAKYQLSKSSLGAAMLTGQLSSVAIGVYHLMRDMGYSVPQVGATTNHPSLSSKAQFPLYTRVAMSDAYIAVIYGRMMKLFGWSNVCIVHRDTPWNEPVYQLILKEAENLRITVCSNNSKVPAQAEWNDTKVMEVLQEVVQSRVRVLIVLANGAVVKSVLVGLYNLGMRRGDLVLIAMNWLIPSLFDIADSEQLSIVKELIQGAIMFSPSTFVGPIGSSVHQKYIESFGVTPPADSCFYYDAAMIVAHALNDMTARGESWLEPYKLSKAIRNTRFTGCTGFVYIEDQTNDRALMSYTIVNARLQTDGSMKVKEIGMYDPSSLVLFNFTESIQWPGGGPSTPTDVRENIPGCPFGLTQVVKYRPAMLLSAALMSGICLASIGACVFIWKAYWNFGTKRMATRIFASFDDYFVYGVMGVEAVQYIAVGIELRDWAFLFQFGGRVLAARAAPTGRSQTLWYVFDIAIGFVILWIVVLVLPRCRCSKWCKYFRLCGDRVTQFSPQILGEICFVPITSSLLAIFQCYNVISKPPGFPTLNRAYLEWDCDQYCWSGWHLAFATTSFLCLLIYIPTAVYMRPAWQHIPIQLHIHSSPAFLMLKSIYQLSIVTADRVLKAEYPTWATVTFLVLTALFGVATLRIRPFNYSRANLWHLISLLVTVYVSILHIGNDLFPASSNAIWRILLFLGLSLIIAAGVLFQSAKLPSHFASSTRIEVSDLFRFMFSRGGRYLNIVSKSNTTFQDERSSQMTRRAPVMRNSLIDQQT